MTIWLVGFKCYQHRYGCECTIDVPKETKEKFERDHGFEYDDYCMYYLIQAENESDLTLDYCLKQQGATEYETAKEIWVERDVIWNTTDGEYNKEPRAVGEYEGEIRTLKSEGNEWTLKVDYDNREASGLVEITGETGSETVDDKLDVVVWANGTIKSRMHLCGSGGTLKSGIENKQPYFIIYDFKGTGRFDVEYTISVDIDNTTAKVVIEKVVPPDKEIALDCHKCGRRP